MNDNNLNNVPNMNNNNGAPIAPPEPPVTPLAGATINETPVIQGNTVTPQVQTPEENVMPETLKEEIRQEQANQVQPKKKKHVVRKIFNFLITIALFAWIAVIVYDFYNVQNKNEPKFCFTKGETKNDDGTVSWCKGAGYIAYKYDYGDVVAYEFGPFWQEVKTKTELEAKGN